eukprot:jgi/Bigna1/73040/fgenesh1_pg.22_\
MFIMTHVENPREPFQVDGYIPRRIKACDNNNYGKTSSIGVGPLLLYSYLVRSTNLATGHRSTACMAAFALLLSAHLLSCYRITDISVSVRAPVPQRVIIARLKLGSRQIRSIDRMRLDRLNNVAKRNMRAVEVKASDDDDHIYSLVIGPGLVEAGKEFQVGGDEMVGCSSWLGHFGLAEEDPATYAAAGCALANAGREFFLAGDTISNAEGCSSMRAAALEGAWTSFRQIVNEFHIAAASAPGGIENLENSLEAAASDIEKAAEAGENGLDPQILASHLAESSANLKRAAEALDLYGREMASEQGVKVEAGQCLIRSAEAILRACGKLSQVGTS